MRSSQRSPLLGRLKRVRYRSLGFTKPLLESDVGAASVFGCRALLQDAAGKPRRAVLPRQQRQALKEHHSRAALPHS